MRAKRREALRYFRGIDHPIYRSTMEFHFKRSDIYATPSNTYVTMEYGHMLKEWAFLTLTRCARLCSKKLPSYSLNLAWVPFECMQYLLLEAKGLLHQPSVLHSLGWRRIWKVWSSASISMLTSLISCVRPKLITHTLFLTIPKAIQIHFFDIDKRIFWRMSS